MRKLKSKPLFTISVAAELTDSHPRTLMLYEQRGVLHPARTATNRRLYSPQNIAEIRFIQHLTQKYGINLAGVKIIQKAIKFCRLHKVDLRKELFPEFKEPDIF